MDELFSKGVDRRVFVKGVGFVSMGLVMGLFGGCETWWNQIKNRPTRRRLRTGSAAVDADIATYREGVELMKALPASDPRNWTNIATIHGDAGGFNFCEHGTDHFFDWHRGYLFHLEKIIQKLTGESKFGLPYWNWNQNEGIHSAFLDSSSALFLARNRDSMSGSWNITTDALDPIFADTNFFTFGTQIEGTPHNNVHTYIGGTLGGSSSALDPLFYMHHDMIDYCWAKWNIELGNDNTNDTTWINHVNSHYTDADGNPAEVTAGITTLMPLLSYQFESSAIGSSPAKLALGDLKKIEARIRKGANVRFEVRRRVPIAQRATLSVGRPLTAETPATPRDFASVLHDQGQEKLFVHIQTVEKPTATDFVVRVFINLPGANRNTPTSSPHHAGSFGFFGERPEPGATPRGHQHQPRFLVNATETLQRLQRMQLMREETPITVTLVPVPFGEESVREDASFTIDQLELIVTPVIVKTDAP